MKWNVALDLRDGHIRRDKDEGGLWSNGIMVIKKYGEKLPKKNKRVELCGCLSGPT